MNTTLFPQMSIEEQTAHLERINLYVSTILPRLITAGRAMSQAEIEQFHEGLSLLSVFPQYTVFVSRLLRVRSDYDQYVVTMHHQFKLLIDALGREYTLSTRDGQRIVVVTQQQSLRRGRPTQAESEQRRRDEQAAAHAEAVSRLTGATISTREAAPVEERESDTSRRKESNEIDLFEAAVQQAITEGDAQADVTTLPDEPGERTQLRFWLPILPAELAASVRNLRDLRAQAASESNLAKALLIQGAEPAQLQPHTEKARAIDRQITDTYIAIDKYLSTLYVMLTEVNAEYRNIAARYKKTNNESREQLLARLKPYATKMKQQEEGWHQATLEACRKEEQQRIERETRDPEKEKQIHQMDAYIRRKDVKPTDKRLAKMREYRDTLAKMGADKDALMAYDVFIESVEKELKK